MKNILFAVRRENGNYYSSRFFDIQLTSRLGIGFHWAIIAKHEENHA
jgi:hypothetical protein